MLPNALKLKIHKLMIKARVLEERLIKMSKSNDGYFWIGGPGEEAFNVCLGLLIDRGEGLNHDCLHFHYRNSATMLAMGEAMIDTIRQMASRATDPYSGGRNFVAHYAKKSMNVFPVTSTIETQYLVALGTARAQMKHQTQGITIVTGGDAGTAEGDFASCLNWSSRPNEELPILIIVTNNRYGISTPYAQVHGDQSISKRANAFGIEHASIDGNSVEEAYEGIVKAMKHVRQKRKPFLLEAFVSRLHGHSSSSGANRVQNESDPIEIFQNKLIKESIISEQECENIKQQYEQEAFEALKQVREEPFPSSSSVFDHMWAS